MPTSGHPLTPTRRVGQVISISPTPTPTVEVTIGADPSVTQFVPYLDSYKPTVGDYVVLLGTLGDYVVLGVLSTGVVTENSGHVLAATSAGGSIVGIAHGLSGTPTAIFITYLSPNSVVVIRRSNVTATTFDVNCRDDTGAAIATTNISFDWYARL